MITVCIFINNTPIYTRSAVNITEGYNKINEYQNDDGNIIKHDPDDGAIVLAKKMLDTIKEKR